MSSWVPLCCCVWSWKCFLWQQEWCEGMSSANLSSVTKWSINTVQYKTTYKSVSTHSSMENSKQQRVFKQVLTCWQLKFCWGLRTRTRLSVPQIPPVRWERSCTEAKQGHSWLVINISVVFTQEFYFLQTSRLFHEAPPHLWPTTSSLNIRYTLLMPAGEMRFVPAAVTSRVSAPRTSM